MKEFKYFNNGKVIVIKPSEHQKIIPLFCPLCDFPNKTADDANAIRKYNCCHLCSLKFAAPREQKWNEEGWRPTKEEMKEYLEERKLLSRTIINIG